MPAKPLTRETREVPAQALRLRGGAFAFAKGEGEEHRFSMLARSSDAITHWYWGRLVHDFDGMRRRDQIATDYCHDVREVLGFVDQFTVEADGLHLAGELVPFTEQDRASEVLHKGRAGVPYEASIDFYSEDLVLEWIPEGTTTLVNGKQFAGPGVIVREWPLRGVAICPYGQDEATHTQFAAEAGDQVPVTLFCKEGTMPKHKLGKTATGKPATKPAKLAAETATATDADTTGEGSATATAGDAAGETAAPAVDDDEADAATDTAASGEAAGSGDTKPAELDANDPRAECRRFVAAFGAENGSKWFGEGVAFDAAQGLHIAELNKQLAASNTANADLKTKLSQVQLGETAPVSGGAAAPPADPKLAKFTTALGDNLGKAAAAIKIPGRK
jgi:hypothetical protein